MGTGANIVTCNVDKIAITEGWKVGTKYFSKIEYADKESVKQGFKNFDDLYEQCQDEESEEYDPDFCYWTEFE